MSDLKLKDIIDFKTYIRVAGEHGRGVNKSIDLIVTIRSVNYQVKSNKEIVLETGFIQNAIDAYNEA